MPCTCTLAAVMLVTHSAPTAIMVHSMATMHANRVGGLLSQSKLGRVGLGT